MLNLATDPRLKTFREIPDNIELKDAMVQLIREDCPPMKETLYFHMRVRPFDPDDSRERYDGACKSTAETILQYQVIARDIRDNGFDMADHMLITTNLDPTDGSVYVLEGRRRFCIGLALVEMGLIDSIPGKDPPPVWMVCPGCKKLLKIISRKNGEMIPQEVKA